MVCTTRLFTRAAARIIYTVNVVDKSKIISYSLNLILNYYNFKYNNNLSFLWIHISKNFFKHYILSTINLNIVFIY